MVVFALSVITSVVIVTICKLPLLEREMSRADIAGEIDLEIIDVSGFNVEIDGYLVNFGTDRASSVAVDITIILYDGTHKYKTIDIGSMNGHDIERVYARYYLGYADNIEDLTWRVTWT